MFNAFQFNPHRNNIVFYCLVLSDGIGDLYHLINLAHPQLLKAYPSMHELKPTYMVLIDEARKQQCKEILDQYGMTENVHVITFKQEPNFVKSKSYYQDLDPATNKYIENNPALASILQSAKDFICISSHAQKCSAFVNSFKNNRFLGEHAGPPDLDDYMGFSESSRGIYIPWHNTEKLEKECIEDEKYKRLLRISDSNLENFFESTEVFPCYIPFYNSERDDIATGLMIDRFPEFIFSQVTQKNDTKNLLINSNISFNTDQLANLNKAAGYPFQKMIVIDYQTEKTETFEYEESMSQRTITVLCHVRLANKQDYLRLLSHAQFIGCGGDTSFQDCLGMGKIPYYFCRNPKLNMFKSFLRYLEEMPLSEQEDARCAAIYCETFRTMADINPHQYLNTAYTKDKVDTLLDELVIENFPKINPETLLPFFAKVREHLREERNVLKKLPESYIGNTNDRGDLLVILMNHPQTISALENAVNEVYKKLIEKSIPSSLQKANHLKNSYRALLSDQNMPNLLAFMDHVNTHQNNRHLSDETNTYQVLLSAAKSALSESRKISHKIN